MNITQYKKEYCEKLIDHMKQGYSFESFGAEAHCSRKTLYNWMDENKEFAEAKVIGDNYALKFLETIAIGHLRGIQNQSFNSKTANPAMAMFFLKTRSKGVYVERVVLSQEDTEIEFV
jgi:hypothetical protein